MRENRILGCLVMREKWMDFGEPSYFLPAHHQLMQLVLLITPNQWVLVGLKKNNNCGLFFIFLNNSVFLIIWWFSLLIQKYIVYVI